MILDCSIRGSTFNLYQQPIEGSIHNDELFERSQAKMREVTSRIDELAQNFEQKNELAIQKMTEISEKITELQNKSFFVDKFEAIDGNIFDLHIFALNFFL